MGNKHTADDDVQAEPADALPSQANAADIRTAPSKLDVVDGICAQLEALDVKLTKQAARLDQVHMKVDLSYDAIGRAQQGQTFSAHCGKQPQGPGNRESSSPTASEVSDGILGTTPVLLTQRPPPTRYPLVQVRGPNPEHRMQSTVEE